MSKEIIIVYGNIASGKSTFSRLLNVEMPDFKHICLDEYRLKHIELDLAAIKKEKESEKCCLIDLKAHPKVIYETTGVSAFFNAALRNLRAESAKIIFVKIDCSAHTCIRRFNNRAYNGHFSVKPPFSGKSIQEVIYDIDARLCQNRPDIVLSSVKFKDFEMVAAFLHYLSSCV